VTEPMSHEDLSELVAAYALDAVDASEALMIEEHLAVCPRCRAELAEHREVTALLAHTGAPAPDGLWDRIAATLDEAPPPVELGDVLPLRRDPPVPAPATTGGRNRLWAVAAAAAAVVVALLGVQVVRQEQQLDDLRAQIEEPADPSIDDPDATLVDLTSADGDVRVQALVDDDGRGTLIAHGLPALAAGQTYQLWGVVDEGQPISLGVLGRDPRTVVFHVTDAVRVLAVTAERAPGVVVSEQDPVVAGERVEA